MDDTFLETPLTPSSQARMDEDRSVSRLARLFPDKLRDLCQMHLTFILDFSDSKLEMMMEDNSTVCKRKLGLMGNMFKPKEKASHQGLFGAPLTDVGVGLMLPLITFLKRSENLRKEGLFRKAGNGRKMRLLKEQLSQAGAEIVIDPEQFGSHDVACVLKEFLRELPEPLLTEKHMEAHRQIRGLGRHASEQEQARYSHKKLSAIQYLMRLLPVPTQKMVRHLMKLLHRVSQEPATKMTADTLGTIFAPICFLNRKAAATDISDIVGETEPTVAYMIQHSDELFEVPRELAIDVISFWKEVEKCNAASDENSENETPCKLKRYPSGPIVNTAVCYADRRASADTASTTQTELANLLAHVQSLPDTPANLRLKRQIQKNSSTPLTGEKKASRGKSIGASLRKRLPSLGRKTKGFVGEELSILTNTAESYRNLDCLNDVSLMSNLLSSPESNSRGRSRSRENRPRSKRPLSANYENDENQDPDCTPKKKERHVKSYSNIVSPKENGVSHLSTPALLSSVKNKTSTPTGSTSKHGPHCSLGDCKCGKSAASNLNTPVYSHYDSHTPLSPVSASLMSFTSGKMDCISEAEKEIDFIPYHSNTSRVAFAMAEANSPQPQKLRKCTGPSTPIMKRSKLQMSLGFETAI